MKKKGFYFIFNFFFFKLSHNMSTQIKYIFFNSGLRFALCYDDVKHLLLQLLSYYMSENLTSNLTQEKHNLENLSYYLFHSLFDCKCYMEILNCFFIYSVKMDRTSAPTHPSAPPHTYTMLVKSRRQVSPWQVSLTKHVSVYMCCGRQGPRQTLMPETL